MNEQEIKQEFEKLWNKIKEIESKLQNKEILQANASSNISDKKQSIKEFLISINPNNDVKRAVCIGYYLEKFENKSGFANKNIVDGFRRAKCTVPLNVPDKIQKAISNGWFDQGKEKGTYVLTITGEKVVVSKFNNSKKNE